MKRHGRKGSKSVVPLKAARHQSQGPLIASTCSSAAIGPRKKRVASEMEKDGGSRDEGGPAVPRENGKSVQNIPIYRWYRPKVLNYVSL